MRALPEIDPDALPGDARVVGRLRVAHEGTPEEYFILIDLEHAILAHRSLHRHPTTGGERWLAHQVEIPKTALPWLIHTLDEKFFRSSTAGGLPQGSLHHQDSIEGEDLSLIRGAAVRGAAYPGYDLYTLSRPFPGRRTPKSFPMSDEALFEQGLFDLLESVAERIENGEL